MNNKMDEKLLQARLREAFGDASQEAVASKLKMSQGNVSKWLSGEQVPTTDTLFLISRKFDVSVDWLLGLSEKKRITKEDREVTYETVATSIFGLKQHGSSVKVNDQYSETEIKLRDPLLCSILKKGLALMEADRESYINWAENKLVRFEGKRLLWESSWREPSLAVLVQEASSESNWIETYEEAKRIEDEFAEMMGENTSPFSEENND